MGFDGRFFGFDYKIGLFWDGNGRQQANNCHHKH